MVNTSGENVWTLLEIKGGMQQNVSRNEEEENSAKAEDCHEVCLDLTREEVVTLEEEEESDFSDECEMDFDVSKDLWVKKQRNSSWVEGTSALWSTILELIALPSLVCDLLHPIFIRLRLLFIFPVRCLQTLFLRLLGRPRI